jgi:hypothetical protein
MSVVAARKFPMLHQSFHAAEEVFLLDQGHPLGLTVGLGRDDRSDSPPGEGADDRVGVVRLVANQDI